jgi:hypothetical protein
MDAIPEFQCACCGLSLRKKRRGRHQKFAPMLVVKRIGKVKVKSASEARTRIDLPEHSRPTVQAPGDGGPGSHLLTIPHGPTPIRWPS